MSSPSTLLGPMFRQRWICASCTHQSVQAQLLKRHKNHVSSSPFKTFLRHSSTEIAPPPLMSKLKEDLKTAMRAKDKPRLNVLRAMISEINNSTKTNSPITTDVQVLALLRKKKTGSQAAQKEALEQSRPDIADKQQGEIDIMDEYAGQVKVMSDQEIEGVVAGVVKTVKETVAEEKARGGAVLKEIFAKGGVLDGKSVERGNVVKVVNELLGRS